METKPGIQTTEFWTTMFGNVLGLVQLIGGPVDVNNKYVVIGVAVINGLYAASRGLAKQGVPFVPGDPAALEPPHPDAPANPPTA